MQLSREWMKFINVKTALQMTLLGQNGPPICEKLRGNMLQNDRSGLISFMATSRLKVGRNSFQNRLKSAREFTVEIGLKESAMTDKELNYPTEKNMVFCRYFL